MKAYRKILTLMAVLFAVTIGAVASPVYYTIFHALDKETMEVFTAGGRGTLSISRDGGNEYHKISSLNFDHYGRAFARVAALNRANHDDLVKLEISFKEGENGVPLDTVKESTVSAFIDSLSPYKRWPWLTYAPVYVEYETLPDIVDTAIGAGQFNILVKAVQTAGLEETLRGEGPFTVFAPTDAAFTNLLTALPATPEQLLNNPELTNILLYHVLGSALDGDAVAAEEKIETLLGKDIEVEVVDGQISINGAKVVLGNIEASNGIIHVIDRVLLPPQLPTIADIATDNDDFSILELALLETGLNDLLASEGPFTVFAPTDAAFEKLGIAPATLLADPELANILAYHVVDGRLKADDVLAVEKLMTKLGLDVKVNITEDGVFINNSKLVATNIKAENGIIHVIDTVLIPESMPNLVEVAVGAGQFTILADLLDKAGLIETLENGGPFTVFAPTDDAFNALPKWLLHYLQRYPALLKHILLYHVAPGNLNADEVIAQRNIRTLKGSTIHARVQKDHVYINRSKVLEANIEAQNGTIHIIDRVLLPWQR